ncbi:hypothetical protein SK128_009556, partial [Halocaridina rubra]
KKKDRGTWIKESEDQIVDFLDASAGQALVSKRPKVKSGQDRAKMDENAGFKVDELTGRLIITDESGREKESASKMDFMEDIDEYLGLKEGAQSGKIKNRKRTLSVGSEEDLIEPPKKASGIGPNNEKRNPTKKRFAYGSEFRSKKAGGDMTNKDKKQPYAY